MGIAAELGLLSAEAAIGTATQLTAYITGVCFTLRSTHTWIIDSHLRLTEVNATPVVQVSSKGGQAITMATGTAGATTSFAGATFVAVPNR